MEKLKSWNPPWLGRLVGAGGGTVKLSMAVVISWMLDLFLSFLPDVWRRKYFWAWLATCVGVLVTTTFLEMLLQSPLPYLSSPIKNSLKSIKSYWVDAGYYQSFHYKCIYLVSTHQEYVWTITIWCSLMQIYSTACQWSIT